MTEKISNEVYIIDGCVIDSDFFYIATQLEAVDPDEYKHTRMSVFDAQSQTGHLWGCHDVGSNIVAVAVKRSSPTEKGSLVGLSKEGEVEFFSNSNDSSSTWEKIPEAGLRLGSLGYMNSIRVIGQSLFACGYNSQVYQRKNGQWTSLTVAPLRHCHAASDDYGIFNSIDGFNENDVYAVGWKGAVWHWNGQSWRKIETPIDSGLRCVRCYGTKEVWLCGENGALQIGNADIGFKELSSVDDNQTFYSLAQFKGVVYIASYEGLYYYDATTKAIKLVISGLKPEIEAMNLDAVESTLWSFGGKDITNFDGTTWRRLDHPDNPPIR